MPLQPGFLLNNRYRIVKLLGQGGFGAVYRAWDTSLKGVVAVKERLDISPASIEQFELEARLLFKLRHPNLPRVSDYFIIPNQGQYLVIDFIEGEDLASMIENAPQGLPIKQVCNYLIQVCDALIYLHNQEPPIIHRDIKPANIRISSTGQAMLVDFGVAKVYEPQKITKPGAQSITPGYSPPEQFGLGTTNVQSDVYALGATAYHLLTGKTPPPAMDLIASLVDDPVPVQELSSQIPLILSETIQKAMQLDRSERLGSVAELKIAFLAVTKPSIEKELNPPDQMVEIHTPSAPNLNASDLLEPDEPLDNYESGTRESLLTHDVSLRTPTAATQQPAESPRPSEVSPATSVERATQRSLTRIIRAWLPMFIGLVLLTILLTGMVVTGVALWKQFAISNETALSPASPTPEISDKSMLPARTKPPGSLTPSTPALEVTLPSSGTEGMPLPIPTDNIRAESVGNIVMLASWSKAGASQITWSPDSQFFALATSEGIHLYRPGDLTISFTIMPSAQANSIAFSPDNTKLAAGLEDSTVNLWEIPSGNRLRALEWHNAAVNWVAFSPDNFLLASAGADGDILLWQIEHSALLRTLEGHRDGVNWLAFSPDGTTIISASDDFSVRVWQTNNGALLQTVEEHKAPVNSVAYSSNGLFFASASEDNTVRLAFTTGDHQPPSIETADEEIRVVIFSPDSSLLVGGAADGKILFWGTSTGAILTTLSGHTDRITSLVFSSDSRYLASVSVGGEVRIWGIYP